MSQTSLNVQIIYAPETMIVPALAARGCYSGDSYGEIVEKHEDTICFDPIIEKIKNSGHLSVLEHMVFTFAIEGVSRSLLAQLTRHRIASFSVESQRYVNHDNFEYVVPESIKKLGKKEEDVFKYQMDTINLFYKYWIKELGNNESGRQDARYVLPNAASTKLIMTMNARELLHVFSLRCCNRAQWEIRQLADAMLEQCIELFPEIFEDAGSPCVNGICPEGIMSCGKPRKRK